MSFLSKFVIIPAKCKFCGCALQLKIHNSPAGRLLGEQLFPWAACNRCADLHMEFIRLNETIGFHARLLAQYRVQFRAAVDEKQTERIEGKAAKTKKAIHVLAQQLALWWAKKNHAQRAPDPVLLIKAIEEKPDEWTFAVQHFINTKHQ